MAKLKSTQITGSLHVQQGITGSATGPIQFRGTASWAASASYALNGGSTGTSLTTGSTYPITSSWAENAKTASKVIEASTGTGNLVRASEPTITSPTINTSLLLNGGGTNTELNPDTNTLTITNEFATSPVVINVSDGNITANNFYGTASIAKTASYYDTASLVAILNNKAEIYQTQVTDGITISTPGALTYISFSAIGSDAQIYSEGSNDLTINAQGGLTVDGNIYGTLIGTSSWAISASYAKTASLAVSSAMATLVTVTNTTTGTTYYPAFVDATSGNQEIRTDSTGLTYNSTNNALSLTSITASLQGSASYAKTSSFADNVVSASHALKADVTTEISTGTGYLVRQSDPTINIGFTTLTPVGDGMGIFDSDYSLNIAHFTAGEMYIDTVINGNHEGPHTGSTYGTASWAENARTASNVNVTPSEDASDLNIVFHDSFGSARLYSDQNSLLRYNPMQAILYADTIQVVTGFIGDLTGTADNADKLNNFDAVSFVNTSSFKTWASASTAKFAGTAAFASNLNMAQSLIPSAARTYDLGSIAYSWYNIYGRLPRNAFRNVNGDNPYYFPEICNTLFAADRRFTVTRAGWNTGIGNDSTLFDGDYETYNTIDTGKTASIHIDLTSKGEYNSDGIVYSAGYFFICYYDVNYTTASSGRVKDRNGTWTPISTITNVSPHSYYRIYRYTVPINNYLTEIYLDFTASATVRIVEMEYQLTRHGDQPSPYFDKSKNTKTYADIEFKDSSNSTTIGLNASNGTVTGSLFYGTSSWANNVIASGIPAETYVTMALDGNNGITCSFNDTNEYVSVPTGALYTFTSSNAPTGTTVKELTLYIDNTAALTSSLSFPSTWLWIGAKPTYITSSKSAVLQLKHFGDKKTIATFASEY